MTTTTLTRPNTTDDGTRNTTGLPGRNVTGLPGWSTFDSVFEPLLRGASGDTRLKNYEDRLEWSIDMPGVGEDNIEITVDENNVLSIQTSYEEETRTEKRHHSKTMKLGDSVDVDGIEASYEDGVLTVTLPKAEREENTKHIELN